MKEEKNWEKKGGGESFAMVANEMRIWCWGAFNI
jgi:hypothetical protein